MNKKIIMLFCIFFIAIFLIGCVTDSLVSPVKSDSGKEQSTGQAAKKGVEKTQKGTDELNDLVDEVND